MELHYDSMRKKAQARMRAAASFVLLLWMVRVARSGLNSKRNRKLQAWVGCQTRKWFSTACCACCAAYLEGLLSMLRLQCL